MFMEKKRGPQPKYPAELISRVRHLYYCEPSRNGILGLPASAVQKRIYEECGRNLTRSQVRYIATLPEEPK